MPTPLLPPPPQVMDLCQSRRGSLLQHSVVGGDRTLFLYELPLSELAGDFYNELKSRTQGCVGRV